MEASFWDGKRAPGIQDNININEFETVLDVFEFAVNEYAHKKAFTSLGHTLTYRDVEKYSRAFAAYIQYFTDLRPGDRIAIQLPNCLQYPIAVFGALRAGLIIVNTNPLYTAREMLHQFKDAGVRALLFIDMFGDRVEEVAAESGIDYFFCTSLADVLSNPKRWLINTAAKKIKKMVPEFSIKNLVTFRQILARGKKKSYIPVVGKSASSRENSADRDDIVVLQYTGGTTGVAKGAMLTNGNIIANMLQAKSMINQVDDNGNPLYKPGNEIIIAPLPLYHIYSFTIHLMCLFSAGEHSIFIANPRDTKMFIRTIRPWKFTSFVGLNTLFVSLMEHPDFKKCDFSALKLTLSGGTALTSDTVYRWKDVTGCDIAEGYGLTECSPIACGNPSGGLARIGTVGVPAPDTAVKVIDDDGNELPFGARGELCIRGPQVMKGYWQRPDETEKTFTKDGWLKTGDIATIEEDGYVKIVDRLKDLIIVSGFNVYPNEIEDVVTLMPEIVECAVIGVEDRKSGEVPKLFVVTHEPVTTEKIMAHCRERLTSYKLPKTIEFIDELPKTPVGKILRRELKELVLARDLVETTIKKPMVETIPG